MSSENRKPVFQPGQAIPTQEAVRTMFALIKWIEQNLAIAEYYFKIPHALSAIYRDNQTCGIDTDRSLSQEDPYIKEEARLAPPESKTDRFWRRNDTRLTYLVSQCLWALLTGQEPNVEETAFPADKLIVKHNASEIDAIQQFFATGLAQSPDHRYLNIHDFSCALEWLEYKLGLTNAGFSPNSTSRHLPLQLKPAYQEGVATVRVTTVSPGQSPKYELQVWNPSYPNAAKFNLDTPSVTLFGRKAGPWDDLQNLRETPPVVQECEEKEGKIFYNILIEGDHCLSRKHMELHLSNQADNKPFFKDLGSTHGIVLFSDRGRTIINDAPKLPSGELTFANPEDQYLKLGNTFLRIRLQKADLQIKNQLNDLEWNSRPSSDGEKIL